MLGKFLKRLIDLAFALIAFVVFFPVFLFDTLAASRPVLIHYYGWQSEVIKNDKLGYTLLSELTDEAVQSFVKYTQEEEKILEQQSNAFNKAKSAYSLLRAMNKYSHVINQIDV